MGPVEMPLAEIGGLSRNLSCLGHDELRDARQARDERMTVLFRRWASLSVDELRELRKLSDARQRLARHVPPTRSSNAVTSRTASPIEIACATMSGSVAAPS
jgi:hypothetical protein